MSATIAALHRWTRRPHEGDSDDGAADDQSPLVGACIGELAGNPVERLRERLEGLVEVRYVTLDELAAVKAAENNSNGDGVLWRERVPPAPPMVRDRRGGLVLLAAVGTCIAAWALVAVLAVSMLSGA